MQGKTNKVVKFLPSNVISISKSGQSIQAKSNLYVNLPIFLDFLLVNSKHLMTEFMRIYLFIYV